MQIVDGLVHRQGWGQHNVVILLVATCVNVLLLLLFLMVLHFLGKEYDNPLACSTSPIFAAKCGVRTAWVPSLPAPR